MSTSLNKPSRLAWFSRIADCLLTLFTCVDQMFCVCLRSPFYIVRGGERPSADETLSAFVGRMAILNHPWALRAERVIDFLMTQKGHCRAAISRDDLD